MSQLSEDQLNQYECFRRSTFPKSLIKKVFLLFSIIYLLKHILQTTKCKNITQNIWIILSGVTKVLVGQIVVEAITLSELSGDVLPLKPIYIRYAYLNLLTRGEIAEIAHLQDFNVDV